MVGAQGMCPCQLCTALHRAPGMMTLIITASHLLFSVNSCLVHVEETAPALVRPGHTCGTLAHATNAVCAAPFLEIPAGEFDSPV